MILKNKSAALLKLWIQYDLHLLSFVLPLLKTQEKTKTAPSDLTVTPEAFHLTERRDCVEHPSPVPESPSFSSNVSEKSQRILGTLGLSLVPQLKM